MATASPLRGPPCPRCADLSGREHACTAAAPCPRAGRADPPTVEADAPSLRQRPSDRPSRTARRGNPAPEPPRPAPPTGGARTGTSIVPRSAARGRQGTGRGGSDRSALAPRVQPLHRLAAAEVSRRNGSRGAGGRRGAAVGNRRPRSPWSGVRLRCPTGRRRLRLPPDDGLVGARLLPPV